MSGGFGVRVAFSRGAARARVVPRASLCIPTGLFGCTHTPVDSTYDSPDSLGWSRSITSGSGAAGEARVRAGRVQARTGIAEQ